MLCGAVFLSLWCRPCYCSRVNTLVTHTRFSVSSFGMTTCSSGPGFPPAPWLGLVHMRLCVETNFVLALAGEPAPAWHVPALDTP